MNVVEWLIYAAACEMAEEWAGFEQPTLPYGFYRAAINVARMGHILRHMHPSAWPS